MNLSSRVIEALDARGLVYRLIDGKEIADYSWAELSNIHEDTGPIVAEMVCAEWVNSRETFESMGFIPDFYQREDEGNDEAKARISAFQQARVVPVVKGSSTAVLFWDVATPALDDFTGRQWLMAPASVIDAIYKSDGASDIPSLRDDEEMESYIQRLAHDCYQRDASDMEISSFATSMRIRFHVLNSWTPWVGHLPIAQKAAFLRALCAMATPAMDYEPGSDQNFKLEMRLHGVDTSWRVAVSPAVMGESITIRKLPPVGLVPSMLELGYPQQQVDLFQRVITSHRDGLILITGETGSGKSTASYSVIDSQNKRNKKIFTIESPVELMIPGVVQLAENSSDAIDERFKVTFASGVRSALRHKPDMIVVGETRDRETAHASASAARTGHLTLTTLHTSNVYSSVNRFADLGVDKTMLADTVRLVASQQLIRKLCSFCRKDMEDGTSRHSEGGCSRCKNTGYGGKVVVAEVCYFDEEARESIVTNTLKSHYDRLRKLGFYMSKRESADLLIAAGTIDPAEAKEIV